MPAPLPALTKASEVPSVVVVAVVNAVLKLRLRARALALSVGLLSAAIKPRLEMPNVSHESAHHLADNYLIPVRHASAPPPSEPLSCR